MTSKSGSLSAQLLLLLDIVIIRLKLLMEFTTKRILLEKRKFYFICSNFANVI